MSSPIAPLRLFVGAAVCLALLSGCGQKNSYAATESALREWLTAVQSADSTACRLETHGLHEQLLADHTELDARTTSCEERVQRLDSSPLPPPDSPIDVPVWDPSGEALVEATDPESNEVTKYWLVFEDGRWLVAGYES